MFMRGVRIDSNSSGLCFFGVFVYLKFSGFSDSLKHFKSQGFSSWDFFHSKISAGRQSVQQHVLPQGACTADPCGPVEPGGPDSTAGPGD